VINKFQLAILGSQDGCWLIVDVDLLLDIYTVWMDTCKIWMKTACAVNVIVSCSIRCLVCEPITHNVYIEDMFYELEA
jgi:hypothetical protein